MIQPDSLRILASPAGAGMTPCATFLMVTKTKSGIMHAHTTMQNGHRIWMTYRAWDQSQTMKMNPSVTPVCSPIQYQRANLAPAKIAMAVVMITAKATIPMNMLGKPKTELCGVFMTLPQDTHGLRSQAVMWLGS